MDIRMSFIESDFPVKEVSKESAREKIFVMDIYQHCIYGGRGVLLHHQEHLFMPV
jgi:hypothetical protein